MRYLAPLSARPSTALTWLFVAFIWLLMLPRADAAVIQSPADPRQYDAFTLPNRMQVLVVSDPKSDKAAAALSVEVGSNANPPGREGLAHFLEHMLFLGTEKYPEADAYQQFISANGGSHNAYTAYDHTTYFFDVKADALPAALDRFAQFFIAPLFTPAYVDRERHAVHSEFTSKIRDDGRRLYDASKLAMNPEHPYSQFMVGNLDTLSDRGAGQDRALIRDDLVRFYEQHYSANLMSLVVIGPESTAALRQRIEALFSAVPDRDRPAPDSTQPLYLEAQLPLQLDVKTLMQTRQLQLTFPVESVRPHWRSKPLYYIASQIGYEGNGSLLSRLKALGWARGLSASVGIDLPNAATFDVGIELTAAGLEHYQQVVALFFEFAGKLRDNGIREALYEEEAQLAATSFRFIETGEPIHDAMRLSSNLRRYPAVHLLDAPYRFDLFDAELIARYLERLTPDNLVLTRAAPTLTTDATSKRYAIDYRLHQPSPEALALWRRPGADPALHVRAENPFIASDFDLVPRAASAERPQRIWHSDDADLWFLQDQRFHVPRANFYATLLTPHANASPRQAVLTALYTRMVSDRLNETLYDAGLAGLSAQLYPHLRGISLRISGYNERQPQLLDTLLAAMQQPFTSPERFARIQHELLEELENAGKEKPYNQTFSALYSTLMPEWTPQQKLDALQTLSLADLQTFAPDLFTQGRLRLLAHGNLTADVATAMAQRVRGALLPATAQPTPNELPVVQLPQGERLFATLPIEHTDSALTLYLQGADTEISTRAEVALLNEIIKTPFYNQLRTERQLGYIVFAAYMPLREVPGLVLVTQSPVSDPTLLATEYDRFLDEMVQTLAQMPTAELEQYRSSLIARINQQDNTLNEYSDRLWRELDRDNAAFDTREALTRATEAITREQLQARLAQLRQRELALRSFGSQVAGGSREDDTPQLMALKAQERFVPGS